MKEKDIEIKKLKETSTQKGTVAAAFVWSVSMAARDIEGAAKEYRTQVLSSTPVAGGFVANRMFVEFTKASRRMTREGETSADTKWSDAIRTITKKAQMLSARETRTLFTDDYPDQENPQSALATELIRLAISTWSGGDDHGIVTSHRLEIVAKVKNRERIIHIRKKQKTENEGKKKDAKTPEKLEFEVNVLCWFAHEQLGGGCVLCTSEYKPSNADEVERKNQADMYASNVAFLHDLPCICVDIAGGTDWTKWTISVSAVFGRPNEWPGDFLLDKSVMFEAQGAEGILGLAVGLLKAKEHFPGNKGLYSNRLGPVVGRDSSTVFKAYDAATYRKPNIDRVRTFIDSEAILWTSHDKKLQLVEMKYIESDWRADVDFLVFGKILRQLKQLHEDSKAHGDIRLANLLSTGVIIDFDFGGNDTYPEGLNEINSDGSRHPDVVDAIKDGRVQDLIIDKKHDYFSMSAVMQLFKAKSDDAELQSHWENAAKYVRQGKLDDAVDILESDSNSRLSLGKDVVLLRTGATPKRKPKTT